MTRVVITGIGIISSLGHDYATFRANLFAGKSGIGPIEQFDTSELATKNAGEVKNFTAADHMDPKAATMMDRVSQFAVAAAGQAIADAGLDFRADEALAESTACIVGSGVGGQNTQEESYIRIYGEKASRLHPLTIPKLMVNAAASQVSMQFGLKGPAYVVASACASANHAIGIAYHYVKSGMARAALAGGTEAALTFGTIKGWEAMRVMAPDYCRPFSKNRSGMSLGEGAAMFVLETLDSATARGARIYGEIIGFGQSADAKDLTSPDPQGAARAVTAAMREAGLQPTDVQYINAHGTGTTVNDQTETAVIKQVFGDHAQQLAISSTKSQTGHALGAAGAVELVAVLAALEEQKAPPTIHLDEPDPLCDLDYVPNTARAMPITVALSNSFAFGGLNAVLAIRKI